MTTYSLSVTDRSVFNNIKNANRNSKFFFDQNNVILCRPHFSNKPPYHGRTPLFSLDLARRGSEGVSGHDIWCSRVSKAGRFCRRADSLAVMILSAAPLPVYRCSDLNITAFLLFNSKPPLVYPVM